MIFLVVQSEARLCSGVVCIVVVDEESNYQIGPRGALDLA